MAFLQLKLSASGVLHNKNQKRKLIRYNQDVGFLENFAEIQIDRHIHPKIISLGIISNEHTAVADKILSK